MCPLTSEDNLLIIYGQVIPPRLVKDQQDTIHYILSKGVFNICSPVFRKLFTCTRDCIIKSAAILVRDII